jgi:hypothetical protein
MYPHAPPPNQYPNTYYNAQYSDAQYDRPPPPGYPGAAAAPPHPGPAPPPAGYYAPPPKPAGYPGGNTVLVSTDLTPRPSYDGGESSGCGEPADAVCPGPRSAKPSRCPGVSLHRTKPLQHSSTIPEGSRRASNAVGVLALASIRCAGVWSFLMGPHFRVRQKSEETSSRARAKSRYESVTGQAPGAGWRGTSAGGAVSWQHCHALGPRLVAASGPCRRR